MRKYYMYLILNRSLVQTEKSPQANHSYSRTNRLRKIITIQFVHLLKEHNVYSLWLTIIVPNRLLKENEIIFIVQIYYIVYCPAQILENKQHKREMEEVLKQKRNPIGDMVLILLHMEFKAWHFTTKSALFPLTRSGELFSLVVYWIGEGCLFQVACKKPGCFLSFQINWKCYFCVRASIWFGREISVLNIKGEHVLLQYNMM